ncbi:MAG: hypothetical protein LBI42_09610 [Chitinispirillales bacterium]|jgi:carbamoyltransferase|nr:hypothetical protein [Chitinispirillales bacterium]
MKITLGIHVGHDRGVALIKDNVVIGAISQERIDRIKYSPSSNIPFDSIDKLLGYCNIKLSNISCIGISYDGLEGLSALNLYHEEFLEHYQCEYIPMYLVSHHEAHAYSAFFASGFSESLIFVADGGGDYINGKQEAESLFVGQNGKISCISQRLQNPMIRKLGDKRNYIIPLMPDVIKEANISIGRKYEQITYLLNLGRGGSGKTMGLASYGKSLINFKQEDFSDFNFSVKYKDILENVFAMATLLGDTFNTFIEKERANIAATAQAFVETSIIGLLDSVFSQYPCKNLCLAGGVFLNCIVNQKILNNFNLDSLFVMPPAGDDGQAIGAAFFAHCRHFGFKNKFEIKLPYLGLSYSNQDIETTLKSMNLNYSFFDDDDLSTQIATSIADNKIVALHRGRTEIGPRALCHRSIITSPINPNMKDILNNRVKHRESFRPFGPTVIAEEQSKYFDLRCTSDFMLFAADVKKEYRDKLVAVTHIDNTARVQAVSKQQEPFVHSLLQEVKKIIGFPIILNTSFNIAGQPIVESPLDAVKTFLTADIDVLVIGNYVLKKHNNLNDTVLKVDAL